jgi:hypothetical protein
VKRQKGEVRSERRGSGRRGGGLTTTERGPVVVLEVTGACDPVFPFAIVVLPNITEAFVVVKNVGMIWAPSSHERCSVIMGRNEFAKMEL